MTNEKDCAKCLEISDLVYKQLKTSEEEQSRYTTVIVSVFFISLITIYSSISKDLTSLQRNHFLISFIISVSLFVVNEMVNMIRSYREYTYNHKQWTKYFEKKKSYLVIQQKMNRYNNKLYKCNFWVWVVLFSFSVLAGIYAVGTLLFYAFSI